MWQDVMGVLREGQRFVLTTHVSPDGDGIGCELALGRTLESLGKTVTILNPTETQPRYEFLLEAGEIRTYLPEDRRYLEEADAIIVLDINRWDRLGGLTEPVREVSTPKICIDHHPDPQYFGDLDVSDPSASATGLMIHDLLLELRPSLLPTVIDPLYVSIMTDTGSFRFANTTHRAMSVATDLVRLGAKPDVLYRHVYETSSRGRMRLLGEVLSNLDYEADGSVVHFTVTLDMIQRCGVCRDDAEGFTDIVRGVEGAQVVLSFVEMDDGSTKISLRSKGRVLDVSKLARAFGGGGHANASGIVDERPLPAASQAILAEVRERLSNGPGA